MIGIVLADAGPLYAVKDPDDTHHSRSQWDTARLQAQNLKVVVPYPILLESYSLVMRKLGNRQAHALLAQVTSTSFVENATAEDYQDASVTILQYRDQDLELAPIGSLLFSSADSPSDQIGSSSPVDTFTTRLLARPLNPVRYCARCDERPA